MKYTYSITSNTLNNKVSNDRLAQEIQSSAIKIAFDYIVVASDVLDIYFKDTLTGGDETILQFVVSNHTGEPLVLSTPVTITSNLSTAKDTDGNILVSVQPRLGTSLTIITHNYSDPCTWYTNSVAVVDEVVNPRNSGIYNTYVCLHPNLIDSEHGRLTFDARIDSKYKVIIKVNDVVVTTGFKVDYEAGQVKFSPLLTSNDVVKVSYYYATNNEFRIAALPGKKIKIESVECQFCNDISLKERFCFNFEEWGYNPYALPSKMMYSFVSYKNLKNFIDESNNSFASVLPAMGELTKDIIIFTWHYPASRIIKSSQGAEVRIKMFDLISGNIYTNPITSKTGANLEIATAAFYCVVENE